jgi:hypothetical protein
MFGNAEAGEGIGYVRPVYDLAYWQNPGPDLWWITEYRVDGGDWAAYSSPLTVASDGGHTLEYRATDAAGNDSAVGSKTFQIDKASEVGAPIAGSVPATLSLTLGTPASFGAFAKDSVTLTFKQHIGASDALRTGAYGKTLTFTLSTTTP